MGDQPPPHDFAYIHSDIPPGMTIAEWRAARRQRSRTSTPSSHRPKNHHDTPQPCPRCVSDGLTDGRGLLSPAPGEAAAPH